MCVYKSYHIIGNLETDQIFARFTEHLHEILITESPKGLTTLQSKYWKR